MRTYTVFDDCLLQEAPEPNLVWLQIEAAPSFETPEQIYYPSGCNNQEISLSNIHRESLKP